MLSSDAHIVQQIRSDTGIAFNKKPEMKAKEIAETGVEALKSGQYHQVWLRRTLSPSLQHTLAAFGTVTGCNLVALQQDGDD